MGVFLFIGEKVKRLLIIDALNAYYRNYIVNPSLSANGHPIGGLKGTLQTVQKMAREINPDMIAMVWDGPGGSISRQQQNKNYKQGRKPIRINRETILSEDEQGKNKVWQQIRLMEYLNEFPIVQLQFEQVEADDVIAYLTQMKEFAGWQKVIASSDKDFLQLCDKETILFRPIQKKIHNVNNILEEYKIHPRNFAVARAIVGDPSDNLPGVPRAGLKTVAKKFNFLLEDKDVKLQEIFDYCEKTEENGKIFTNILECKEIVIQNLKLMQLSNPRLSLQCKNRTKYAIANFDHRYNKTEIIKMMNKDGFGVFNWESIHSIMNRVSIDKPLEMG